MRLALAVALLSACRHSAPAACTDDLHGVYVTPAGQRWMLLDNGATLELFPLFDDSVPDGAPRVIDVAREHTLGGDVKRRFMQRDVVCDARAPFHITACTADGVQVVIAEPAAPLAYSPCAWPPVPPSRVETWRRE